MVLDAKATEKLLDGRLKLRHLVLVVTIAEHGSIMRAAEALHVTQPVVTRSLREVEEVLGVPLFDRYSRGVTLNVYGKSFVDHARAVLAQIRHAGEEISLLQSSDLGTVTVGTYLAGSNVLLPRAIAALKSSHPLLTVVVVEATPDVLEADLLVGEIDLTVGRLLAAPPPRLTQEQLYLEPIKIVARSTHPAHALVHPTLSELASYAWVFPSDRTALRWELEEVFVSAGVAIPRDRIECPAVLTMWQLLVQNDLIGLLPASIALQEERFKFIGTSLKSVRQVVGVSWATERPLIAPASALLEHLRVEATALTQALEHESVQR
ncbi:LysR substrate-binding domain-containing protein [Nocardia sp. NBC_00565]|uniref:LysR substrate-binding domain-containing protein n=1 Tax=Nocardia sp. NBC_00565 TaxID=2975993 RepID=UPI002E813642|nr:LysR substrate-binding domain-containing protein [Nocardia sp. NBC_00565]WUC06602.1 LysR substrate-binding domain-containing protein [Nocardia sp. NBC_00565]